MSEANSSKNDLACPFCGGIVDPAGWLNSDGERGPECETCGATAPSLQRWNTRVAAESPPARLRALLRERQGLWCDTPKPGVPYPDYACGKCWTCRVRAALAESPGETAVALPDEKPKWYVKAKERMALMKRFAVGTDVHLLEMACQDYDDLIARLALKTSGESP